MNYIIIEYLLGFSNMFSWKLKIKIKIKQQFSIKKKKREHDGCRYSLALIAFSFTC